MTDCRNLGVVKLHGLDYIAADCGKAFDELIAMLPKVSSDCTWVERWQRALMEAKQYIKSYYKTTRLYVTYN